MPGKVHDALKDGAVYYALYSLSSGVHLRSRGECIGMANSACREGMLDILIIGGTGHMGKIVVQRLLERGDRVTAFSRGSARPEWWDRIEHIQGDRDDRPNFMAKLKGRVFDAVVDSQAHRKEDVESAVETFRGNIGRYLMVSTGSVYLEGTVDFFFGIAQIKLNPPTM